jgi:hypothetical protein
MSTEELPDPDCANAITVEPWFSGIEVACQRDRGGCGWSCAFPGTPELRRISWAEVSDGVEKHLRSRGPIAVAEMRGYERAVVNLRDDDKLGEWMCQRWALAAAATGKPPWPPNLYPPRYEYADYLDAMKETDHA